MPYITTYKGEEIKTRVEEIRPNFYRVVLGDREYEVDFLEPQKNLYSLIIGGKSYEVDVDAPEGSDVYGVGILGDHFEVEVVEEKKKKLAAKLAIGVSGRQDMKSPMAGNVWKLLVKEGDQVTAGQVLLILEAMKMENEIKSSIDGTVTSVAAKEGVPVAAGDPLCVVEPPEEG